jgi:ATP-dependent DNA helicase RecG
MNPGKIPRPGLSGLSMPLNLIKGVGPKRAGLLGLKGLDTILDLFNFTPIRYEDRSTLSHLNSVQDGQACLIKGTVIEGREEKFFPSRKRIYRIVISGNEGVPLELVWFHYIKPHLAGFSRKGMEVTAFGAIKTVKSRRQMFHPDIRLSLQGSKDLQGFVPVYSSIRGISDNTLRTIIRTSIDNYLKDVTDPIPDTLLKRLSLPGLREAIEGVHFPPENCSIDSLNNFGTPFHKRFMFDRFFYVMLSMALRKKKRAEVETNPYVIPEGFNDLIKGFFEFTMTSDQNTVIEEIAADLRSGRPMNRLLMGDVGTGKTAVAAVAACLTVLNKRQAALMAPTQILAEQHFEYFSSLPHGMGFRPVILSGAMKKAERDAALQRIGSGEFNMVIGTHSLIGDGVQFADLGLAVIDEEHRFGVRQRSLLDQKGNNPHILAMTATPIPRSLAITVYGDMDISIMKEQPHGRIPVMTRLVDKTEKRWAFETMKNCLVSGHQAFVICPVIEETEDSDLKGALEMHKRLERVLGSDYNAGIVHGQMPPDERIAVMQDFYRGRIHVLVATTVVEVGVHIPNATLMVIEHPERFGLAQLHQLRGRVGRGKAQGMCLMIMPDNTPEKTEARLRCLSETGDGFEIARKDLEFRGHGELAGYRQSGTGELDPLEIMEHHELLDEAKRCAEDMLISGGEKYE